MILQDGRIRTIVIDVSTLETSSYYWDMLAPKYAVIYMERYEEEGHLLIWNREDGRSVVYPFTQVSIPVMLILDAAEDMTGHVRQETCFVTGDKILQKLCLGYPCICFGIGGPLSFSEAHEMPDYYLDSEDQLFDTLMLDRYYYPGEAKIRGKASLFPPVKAIFVTEGIRLPVYVCGRYFGRGHFLHDDLYTLKLRKIMTGLEPLSPDYVRMLAYAAKYFCEKEEIGAVLSIPPKPGEMPKFAGACAGIAEYCGIENMDTALYCRKAYPSLAPLPREERVKALRRAFALRKGYDYHKNILIIDDVTSSGVTFEEAAQTLMVYGRTEKVCLLTLAIVQFPIGVWLG